jgi:ABC-type multidrug transport system ATPase subunit
VLPHIAQPAFLRVCGISKAFPVAPSGWRRLTRAVERLTVLRDVTFEVTVAEVFGLLGENGAGKTTLLHVLATLVQPDGGSIAIAELDPSVPATGRRRLIGLCSSADRSFYYRLTMVENLRFFGSLVGLSGHKLTKRIEEVIALVDLREFAERRYGQCSSGIRQRASIARALLGDPPLLLLDEPTRTLDPVHTEAIHRLIRSRLVSVLGKTVVLATNVLDEAWQVCDRIAILKKGRIDVIFRPDAAVRPRAEELFTEVVARDA